MKKIFFSILILVAWTTSLHAQITKEQANAIVSDYLKSEVEEPYYLYVNNTAPSEEGITLTTHSEETVKVKYACWVYYVSENFSRGLSRQRYLFVKEDSGNLLEIFTHNDFAPDDLPWAWTEVKMPTGFSKPKVNSSKSLFPNPVDDWLTLPWTGNRSQVEIYDLTGTRLFSGSLSGKDDCQINVSFLSAGVYMVSVSNETGKANYKMIKK